MFSCCCGSFVAGELSYTPGHWPETFFHIQQCFSVRIRPESIMLKVLPKILSGISLNFHLLCSSVFLLCLHYAPRLVTFVTIILEHFNQ